MRYLIKQITSAPILRFHIIDGSSPFILTTDTSEVSVAAALSQVQGGVEYPIAFFSKSLKDTERREMEVAAIVAGINAFRQYLLGTPFTVFTDNASCVQILKKPDLSPKLHRWATMIQDYDFIIQHQEGKRNKVCDALSRVPVHAIQQKPSSDNIRIAQHTKIGLQQVVQYLQAEAVPEGLSTEQVQAFKTKCEQFELIDNLLFKK